MKKLTALVIACSLLSISFATSTILSPTKLNSKEVFIPIGKNGNKISVFDLSTISVTEFQKLTDHKMNFLERASFKMQQRKLRHSIYADGTINPKAIKKFEKDCGSGSTAGGLALGFLLGLIGVLIAYLIKDDCKPNRTKWAWIGCAILVAILLIASLA